MANPYDISYYAGPSLVSHIPETFREYDRRTAYLTKIEEGRANFARLLLEYARRRGAYIAHDTETRWGIEYARLPRIYFTANSASSSGTLHDIITVVNSDAKRLQPGDILNLMGFWVKMDSSTGRTCANATGEDMNVKTNPYIIPEQIKILENYGEDSASSGHTKIKIRRNIGGTAPTGHADLEIDYDNATYQPFLWKAGNSIAEGRDDQWTYSDVDTYDYNYCQIVMRKWSATETERHVRRFFSQEDTFQRNGRRALNEFFAEIDNIALFGTRRTETENGRTKWYAGGFFENVPSSNYIEYGPTLFNTKEFNNKIKNMFYFGSQTKLVLAGADWYTNFSNMLDNKIILPSTNINSWGLELVQYRATNGGTLLVAPSDTLSLNGMSGYAFVIDPEHFRYGHLDGMDIKQIMVPHTNPHEVEAEIYGQITFQRTNPKAHWVFVNA